MIGLSPGSAYGMLPMIRSWSTYPKYAEDMIGVRDRFQRDVLYKGWIRSQFAKQLLYPERLVTS